MKSGATGSVKTKIYVWTLVVEVRVQCVGCLYTWILVASVLVLLSVIVIKTSV